MKKNSDFFDDSDIEVAGGNQGIPRIDISLKTLAARLVSLNIPFPVLGRVGPWRDALR